MFENKLNRQFDVEFPNQVYIGDITYIWTREGWLYLAGVIDLFSRKVVGWSMSSRMKARLVCDALRIAIWQLQPQAELIVHSDRGSQYASRQYRRLLKIHGFIGSMNHADYCFDNAVAESFSAALSGSKSTGGTTIPVIQHSKLCCSIFPCFITAIDCIHTWGTKTRINMR